LCGQPTSFLILLQVKSSFDHLYNNIILSVSVGLQFGSLGFGPLDNHAKSCLCCFRVVALLVKDYVCFALRKKQTKELKNGGKI